MRTPRVFISYSSDSPEHRRWVAQLADALRTRGVDAILDQWDLAPGQDRSAFVAQGVASSDAVIAVITKRYNELLTYRGSGVGDEGSLVNRDILAESASKLLLVVRDPEALQTLPDQLKGHDCFDASPDTKLEETLNALLGRLLTPQDETPAASPPLPSPRRELFISYSHADAKWLERFETMLKPVVDQALIQLWSDTKIKAGTAWRSEIKTALDRARVALLLVSPSFLASDFINNYELPTLLGAVKKDELQIFWVPISSAFYSVTDIEQYQAAHNPAQPLDTLTPARRNKAIVAICQQILDCLGKAPAKAAPNSVQEPV